MATFKKTRRRGELGDPPPLAEAGENLKAPEHAPPAPALDVDGRTLRKTGRTQQFATRITPELHRQIKMIAARDGLKVTELLEQAVAVYEKQKTHG
jgi:hypothetical protein